MDVQFIFEDGRFRVHPDSEQDFLKTSPWHRHAVYHNLCQRVYAEKNPPPTPASSPPLTPSTTSLTETGLEVIRGMLDSEDAAQLSARMGELIALDREDGDASVAKLNGDHTGFARVECDAALKDRIVELFPRILSGDTATTLERYLGSHFRIDNFSLARSYPAAQSVDSFQWHRDVAPLAQVHIIVYLTAGSPGTGQTSFLDLEQSREAARVGYHFPKISSRLRDAGEIFTKSDITPSPEPPELAPGDGVMFPAPRVLHRGSAPRRGFRDVMIMVLNPSFIPWAQDIEEAGTDCLNFNYARCTLMTNPFLPTNPHTHEAEALILPEEWVVMGEFSPA